MFSIVLGIGGGRGVDGGITITLIIKFCEIFFVRYFFLSLEKQLTDKKKIWP